MNDIEPAKTMDTINQARLWSQIEAEMLVEQEKNRNSNQGGNRHTKEGPDDSSAGKKPLTSLQASVLKQHQDQINKIDAESNQKLAYLEEIYRREVSRIENAQTTLTAEANYLKVLWPAIKENAEVATASQQQMLEEMKVEIAQLKEELRSGNSKSSRNIGSRPRREIVCYNCWQTGHIRPNCNNERVAKPENFQYPQRSQDNERMNRPQDFQLPQRSTENR